jgi:hypothetical protein
MADDKGDLCRKSNITTIVQIHCLSVLSAVYSYTAASDHPSVACGRSTVNGSKILWPRIAYTGVIA